MKILHVIPGDNFTEGMGYKDNYLSAINSQDGHDVMILSSLKTWEESAIVDAPPCDKIMVNGVRLVRRPYKKCINDLVASKLRVLDDAYAIISSFKPDVIRVLNPHNFTLPIVVQYKKEHPKVKLYVDSHQEYYNSGIGFLSYWVFHKFLVRRMLRSSLDQIDKIFYCLEGTKTFLQDMYGIPEDKMEFFPMGGVIRGDDERQLIRKRIRQAHGIGDNEVLMIHSGKMVAQKRSVDILKALSAVDSSMFRLILIGSIPSDMAEILTPLIEADERVEFVGWKDADELEEYIIAGDIYLQPGSASATIYKALCGGTAVVVAPDIEGYDWFMNGAGWWASTRDELMKVFKSIILDPQILQPAGGNALKIAKEGLDYKKLARRLCE